MKRLRWLCLLLPAALAAQALTFDERVRSVVEAYAHPAGSVPLSYPNIAAKLWLRQDAASCSRRLEELLAAPTGDMFWMYPVTAIAYLDRGQLSASARRALRNSFRTYMPYRGDTENHWVMYYTSLYLMAQLWPDRDGGQWYTGKSSAENMREAAGWLESWVHLTTTRGQGEYDSPNYMGLYLLSMSYLSAWARDPSMKQRATMMLDYLIADYAAEEVDGVYVGAHSRVYDREVLEKWNVAFERFRLGAVRPRPSAVAARQPDPVLRRRERLPAAGNPAAHRHRPLAALHRVRTQAHPQSLAVFR